MNTMSSLTHKLCLRFCKPGGVCFSSKPRRFEVRYLPSDDKLNTGIEPNIQRKDPNEDDGGLLKLFLGNKKTRHVQVMKFLQGRFDFRVQALELWFQRWSRSRRIEDQSYKEERHKILGADLAAAHFLLHRNCGVQLGGKQWLRKEDLKIFELPDKFQEGWTVTGIDISEYPLQYEGFFNFRNLIHVKVFIAHKSPHLDDWCLDLLTGELPNLQILVLTGCQNVTERGLVTLTKLRKLQRVILGDIPASNTSAFRLTCLMLEDDIPGLVIEGVELDPEVAEKAMKQAPNLDTTEEDALPKMKTVRD